MNAHFYIQRNGQVSGPFTLAHVLAGIKLGKVIDSDIISDRTGNRFVPVIDFRSHFADVLEPSANSHVRDRSTDPKDKKPDRPTRPTVHPVAPPPVRQQSSLIPPYSLDDDSRGVLYRYRKNDRISDLLSFSELSALALTGELSAYDHLQRDGQRDWFLASAIIPSLASQTPSTVAAVPSALRTEKSKTSRGPHTAGLGRVLVEWLSKALILLMAVGAGWYVLETYSLVHFHSVLGGQDASAIVSIDRQAHWLDWYLERVPSYLRRSLGQVNRGKHIATGHWEYEVVTRRGQKISFVQHPDEQGLSTNCLSNMWNQQMYLRGYAREKNSERPDALLIDSLRIQEPGGVVWSIQDTDRESDARCLLILAAMLATSRYKGDLTLLADCDRGSFAYAFAFASITCKLSLDEAIEMSCGENRRKRIFAGELLLDRLPRPNTGSAEPFDPMWYQRMIEHLAERTSFDEKRSRYERLKAPNALQQVE